ncbi:MAG: DUF7005 family protein [Ruminococcus sp.]
MTISEISEKCGLNDGEKKVFLEYISNQFCDYRDESEDDFLFLDRWKMIYNFAQEYSPSEAINKYVCHKRQVKFRHPELLRIEIYNSFVGEIPIIYVPDTEDFENLVTNAIYKGVRPEQLSQTGASFAFGKSTRFIILSSKPYSNIPACELGLDEADWANKSMIIRREHECTHYFTKLHYGISRNCLHDELMADFFGLYEAFGYYKAEYFLKFMGVIPGSGGRLKFYTSELSPKLCRSIEETARSAADFLERYSQTGIFLSMNRKEQVIKFCSMGLAEMCNYSI